MKDAIVWAEVHVVPHLRTDTLEKYFLRRANPARVIRAEEHLLVCGSCRDRLDEFDAFIQSLKDASEATGSETLTAGTAL